MLYFPPPSASGNITSRGFPGTSGQTFWYISLKAMKYLYNVADVMTAWHLFAVDARIYSCKLFFVIYKKESANFICHMAVWSIPLTNVKWHSDPWPTVTSQPIRLSTNFMTLIPSLTFTDYEWFPWSICNGCGMPAGNAYPSGHLVPSPILGLASAPIVETKFLELAMSLLDFSHRIPLGTFSILLITYSQLPMPCHSLSLVFKPKFICTVL